jgi:hypothetical protein
MNGTIRNASLLTLLVLLLAVPAGISEFLVLCISAEGHVEIERTNSDGQCADDLREVDDCTSCVDVACQIEDAIRPTVERLGLSSAVAPVYPWLSSPDAGRYVPSLAPSAPNNTPAGTFLRTVVLLI